MLYVYGSNVKSGKLQDYQEWIRKNLERIYNESPAGWKLSGIYFSVYGFGSHLSEIHWVIENYAAFDEAHKVAAGSGEFGKLVEEWYEYLDVGTQSSRLLKLAQPESTLVMAR